MRCISIYPLVAMLLTALLCGVVTRAQTNLSIDANARRYIGGVHQLDREQFFVYSGTIAPPTNTNIGNLLEQTYSPTGLNAATGRVATEFDQFISKDIPEDPAKPGFFDRDALIAQIQGDYRTFLLTSNRWEPLRQHANPIFVNSGRNAGFWPDYLDGGTQMPTNYEAYADFLNVYLEEVVYGTGPNQGFLPINADRFYVEVMNEPQFTGVAWAEVIEMHQVVTELVKEKYPQAQIGGASCCEGYSPGVNDWDRARELMDDMTSWQTPSGDSVELDFWSIHPYERYNVQGNGVAEQMVFHSPGHLAAIMDLFESYSFQKFGDPKKIAATEYGSFNLPNSNPAVRYGSYARDEQQWDLARDVKEKMLVFMNRPDRVLNAVPFVSAKHFTNEVPTPDFADNVFFEQDAAGVWSETIVGNMFRMFAPVEGHYLPVEINDPDLQSLAFRNGNDLYVILNNLRSETQAVNLEALTGFSNVTQAKWSRIYRAGGTNVFEQDVDVTGSWQNLSLESEAGAVLKLTLAGAELYDNAFDQRTFYGDDTEVAIVANQLIATNIDADLEDAVSAKLRFGYSVPGTLPEILVRVNGNELFVDSNSLEIDDGDDELYAREISVPVGFLNSGPNNIEFVFLATGTGGEIAATVLEVNHSIGDYNTSGRLDSGDIHRLYQQFGPVVAGSKFDLNDDSNVDFADVNEWLALRNVTVGDADVDGDIDSRDAVALLANFGTSASVPSWAFGNFDADNDVDATDRDVVVNGFTGAGPSDVTEPLDIGVSADNPDLIYNPATGSLTINADGQTVAALYLSSPDGFLNQADFAALDLMVSPFTGLSDNLPNELGWVSAVVDLSVGFSSNTPVTLGTLLPTDLSMAELAATLANASWAGFGVGGNFDLVVLLPGDFNGDGIVDGGDYTLWRDTLGSTTDLQADADENGIVDEVDYAFWLANFGATSPAALSQGAVPEPASAALVLLVIAALAVTQSRRVVSSR